MDCSDQLTKELDWYIVYTMPNREQKICQNLRAKVEAEDLGDLVVDIQAPTAEATSFRNGKRITKIQQKYPGYVFVKMEICDKTYWVLSQVPGILGILRGAGDKAQPLTPEEVTNIFGAPSLSLEAVHKGDNIEVKEGPFAGFIGKVDLVEETTLKAWLSMFGREVLVEVERDGVKRI